MITDEGEALVGRCFMMATRNLRRKWAAEKRERLEFMCSIDRQVIERQPDGSYTIRQEPWKVWDEEGR